MNSEIPQINQFYWFWLIFGPFFRFFEMYKNTQVTLTSRNFSFTWYLRKFSIFISNLLFQFKKGSVYRWVLVHDFHDFSRDISVRHVQKKLVKPWHGEITWHSKLYRYKGVTKCYIIFLKLKKILKIDFSSIVLTIRWLFTRYNVMSWNVKAKKRLVTTW